MRLLPEDLPADATVQTLVLPSHARSAPLAGRKRGTQFLLETKLASVASLTQAFDWSPNGKPRKLPTSKARQFIFSSDLGLTKDFNWRPLTEPGALRAPYVSGIAIATDGVLIAILIGDNTIFIGHLDNWIENDLNAVVDEDGDVVELVTKKEKVLRGQAKINKLMNELLA